MADKFETWFGDCRMADPARGTEFTCLASVWAEHARSFRDQLAIEAMMRGQEVLDVARVGPARARRAEPFDDAAPPRFWRPADLANPVEFARDDQRPHDPHDVFRIGALHDIEPLDAQMGVWPLLTVPAPLQEPLFGDPGPGPQEPAQSGRLDEVPPLGSFAILDASRIDMLPMLLESSDLPHRCLFKGEAEDLIGGAAPYLVQLEEGDRFARQLFTTDAEPGGMWERGCGVFLRARAGLDDLWRHFRRFTQIPDGDGKWFFLRFYDHATVTALLGGGIDGNAILARMLRMRDGRCIRLVSCTPEGDGVDLAIKLPLNEADLPAAGGPEILAFFRDDGYRRLVDDFVTWAEPNLPPERKMCRTSLRACARAYHQRFGVNGVYGLRYCLLGSVLWQAAPTEMPPEVLEPLQNDAISPESRSEAFLQNIIDKTGEARHGA